jgi:hypothetical protein
VCNAEILGNCPLKSFDERPETEGAVLEQTAYVGQSLGLDLPPLK